MQPTLPSSVSSVGGNLRPTAPLALSFAPERSETQFPAVPTLFATRLQLELLLSDRTVDLRAAAGIILNDLGATLEIFRRAGDDAGAGQEPLNRLEDCLASLGTDAWMEAVCANAVERVAADSEQLAELTAFWEHGRLLAYACWLVAEQTEGVCPEEAYLIGLLHEVAALPRLLGWTLPQNAWTAGGGQRCWSGPGAPVSPLAAYWRLPEFLHSFLASSEAGFSAPAAIAAAPACWRAVLRTAHAWSQGENCLLSHTA